MDGNGEVGVLLEPSGCRQLINACNWKTADPIKLEDIERWTYTAAEVIAVNRYYNGGAHTGSESGWRIDPGPAGLHFSPPFRLPAGLSDLVIVSDRVERPASRRDAVDPAMSPYSLRVWAVWLVHEMK